MLRCTMSVSAVRRRVVSWTAGGLFQAAFFVLETGEVNIVIPLALRMHRNFNSAKL